MVRAVPRKAIVMSDQVSSSNFHARALRLWLLAVAAMIFMTLIVGGATRLTVSGLSIVEWKPVTGVLPPMTEPAWRAEFEKYQQIPQYRELNRGMKLEQFKVIYYWEWMHRLLARATGAVFLVPFLMFLWRGTIPPPLRLRLWTIFAGGALLGVVGWWMVSSGLAGSTLVKVSQYRLAFHMTFACVIYAAVLWTAQQAATRAPSDAPRPLRLGALAIAAALLAQIYLGALVAGLDAGLKYNTWPLIDGGLMPSLDRLFFIQPLWRNLFENDLMVQFNHRMLADAVWGLSLLQVYLALRLRCDLRGPIVLAAMMTVQAALGIFTLLYEAPLALALAHQALAIVVFTVAVVHAERLMHGAELRLAAVPA
jgi:cytochrome c oxidase assembly protein subunit 15